MRQAGAYSGRIMGRSGLHSLPLARIKKIRGRREDDIWGGADCIFKRYVSSSLKSSAFDAWMVTLQGKRRTLHKEDVAAAVKVTDNFDFLAQLVSELKNACPANAGSSMGV